MAFLKTPSLKYLSLFIVSLCVSFVVNPTASISDDRVGGYIFPGEIHATITGASEYEFRGISRSDKKPSINGGFDWNHKGFYAGVWASNADFGDNDDASTEVDYYAGYKFNITDNSEFDFGTRYYSFPSTDTRLEYRFVDIYAGGSYDFDYFKTGLKVFYSNSYQFDSGEAFYTDFNLEMPIVEDFYFIGHYGYLTVSDEEKFGYSDYGDYEIGFGYRDLYGFDMELTFVDTDLPEESCNEWCDNRIKASLTYKFQVY